MAASTARSRRRATVTLVGLPGKPDPHSPHRALGIAQLSGVPGRSDHEPLTILCGYADRHAGRVANGASFGITASNRTVGLIEHRLSANCERTAVMNARYACNIVLLAVLACALSGGPAALAGGPTGDTQVAEIVLYAIDSDTNELLRYSFSNDSIVSMGAVATASGELLVDMESLSYVPSGPHKGLYAAPTKGSFKRHLVHIDPLTGQATPFGPTVVPSGRKVTGMISDHDPGSGTWSLLAAEGDDVKSDPDRIEPRRLLRINTKTGSSVVAAVLTDGRRFEGLARNSMGQLYAVSRTHFYRIDEDAGAYTVVQIGVTGLDKAEALEFAMGHAQPPVDVPGVGNGWTKYGALFVFDDNSGMFGVLNPNDGSFVEYLVDGSRSTFATDDAEGMILVTLFDDPLFGTVEGFD
jgi:hypothetical protein